MNLTEIEFGIGQPSPLLLVGEVEIVLLSFLLNMNTVPCCVGFFWALSYCGGKSPDMNITSLRTEAFPFHLQLLLFLFTLSHLPCAPVSQRPGWLGQQLVGRAGFRVKGRGCLEWGRWHCSQGPAGRPRLLSPLHAWSKSSSPLWLASRAHSCSVCFLLFWLHPSLLSLFTGQAGC